MAVALGLVVGGLVGWYMHPETKIENDNEIVTIDGQKITLGAEDSVTFTTTKTKNIGASVSTFNGSGMATSAKMDAIAYGGVIGQSLMNFKTSPAEISVGGAKGTLASSAYKASLSVNNGPLLILVAGILCVVSGIVCWVKQWGGRLGIYLTIAGGALITIGLTFASFPWIGLLLIPLAIAAVIYLWWRAKTGAEKETTLKTIVGAVDTLEGNVKKTVTNAISTKAKESGTGANGVKPVVSKIVSEVKKEFA